MDDAGDADGTVRPRRFLTAEPAEGQLGGSTEEASDEDDGTARPRRYLAADPADDLRAETADGASDDDDGWRAPAARARLVVVAVALLLVGVLIGRLTAPDSEVGVATGVEEDSKAEAPKFTFPAGDQSREPWWGLVGFRRLAVDTFDRTDARGGLGETGTGEAWETPEGQWGIEGGQARLYASNPDGPNFAIVRAPEGDGLIEVMMAAPEDDAGLVFRYQDPSNYWAVTTTRSLGVWSVTRTVDGEPEAVAELIAPVKKDTIITVILTGTQIRFVIDSKDKASLDDSTFAGVRTAGLIAPAKSSLEARWDRFLTMEQPAKSEKKETTTTEG